MDRALCGGHVQRVWLGCVGPRQVALFQVRVPGETVYVAMAGGLGIGIVDATGRERIRASFDGETPTHRAHFRSLVEGARVAFVGPRTLDLTRGAGPEAALRATLEGLRLVLLENPAAAADPSVAWQDMRERGAKIAEVLAAAGAGGHKEALARALSKARARVDRRIEAIRGDLARTAAAEGLAERATTFVAEAARAPRGTSVLRAVDWSSGEARNVEIAIDPARAAKEQIAAMFKRAKRLTEGAKIAQERLLEAQTARAKLDLVAESLSRPQPDFALLEASARTAAPRDFKLGSGSAPTRRTRHDNAPRPPFRKFIGGQGIPILVGRSASHNDELTLHVARPRDLWLHAKNRAGAHVIVPLEKGVSCPADVLVQAAHLAAHFSEARDERVVEITYTPRRYVRKPRASAPGAVLVDREKVIVLRKEDDVLRRLLESEADAEKI